MIKNISLIVLDASHVLVDLTYEVRSTNYPEHREQVRLKVIVPVAEHLLEADLRRAAYQRASKIAAFEFTAPTARLLADAMTT